MRGQDPGSEHERGTDNPASPSMPPPSFGRSSGWDAGQVSTPPWGMSDPAPQSWQPPPAFTAAAAGMPVWRGPSWPAATGEPIGEPWPGNSPATPAPPIPGPVPGPVVPGPATTAAAQEAAARNASREGTALPGGPYPAPTGTPPLSEPATGMVLPSPVGPPPADAADPGRSNFAAAEPTSGPTPPAGGGPGTAPPQPGLIPGEPTSRPTLRTAAEPASANGSAPRPPGPEGGQNAQNGTPAGDWTAGTAGGSPSGTPWTPGNAWAPSREAGEGGASADAAQQHRGRPGSPNTDPLDIPVWPPQAAKAEGDAAPAAGGTPPADTTMPVARLKPAAPGASPATPPQPPGAPSVPGAPAVPGAPGAPGTPGAGQPAVPGAQQQPTVAAPILAAPTPGTPSAFTPASGSSRPAAHTPATVAGPFVGFNAGAAPGTGGGRPPSFTPAQPPAAAAPDLTTPRTGLQGPAGKKALVGAAIVVAIGAIGVGAYFAYQGLGDPAGPQAHGKVPSVVTPPQPEPTVSQPIDSAKTDAKEMTTAEAFPSAKVKINGMTFKRVKVNSTGKCEQGAAGRFADALKSYECAKLLRATYVDRDRRYAVTTGIAVLPTRDAAVKVDGAKDLANNVWFRGLPGPSGSGGERVEISGGYAAGLVWGRYIVFSYATYSDGHTPKASEQDLGPISDAFRQYTSKVIEKRASGS